MVAAGPVVPRAVVALTDRRELVFLLEPSLGDAGGGGGGWWLVVGRLADFPSIILITRGETYLPMTGANVAYAVER